MPMTFDQTLDAVEALPTEQQLELLDVMRRRLGDRGRQRVIDEVAESELQFEHGLAKVTTVDDLMREIES